MSLLVPKFINRDPFFFGSPLPQLSASINHPTVGPEGSSSPWKVEQDKFGPHAYLWLPNLHLCLMQYNHPYFPNLSLNHSIKYTKQELPLLRKDIKAYSSEA